MSGQEYPYLNNMSEIYNEVMIQDAGPVQKKILDVFRLTEEFKKVYAEYLFDKFPKGASVTQAVEDIKKFKKVDHVDLKENKSLILDYLYDTLVLGFLPWEFFSYGLEGKNISECLEFMTNRNIFPYYNLLNKDPASCRILGGKFATYQHFKPFFKRELVNIKNKDDREAFMDFISRHKRFIAKPSNQALGKGIRIVDIDDYSSPIAAFTDLIGSKGKASLVCEELIKQHPSFSAIHPESVNSIRIFSYYNGSDTNIVCAWLKAGQGNAVIDNGGAGGIVAAIDEKTGMVYTDAADEHAQVFPTHPDTGFTFKGFQIPQWDELISIIKEIAPTLPGVPMIGWDYALSEDKGWQLIEGNEMGQICVIQVATKRGMRKELTERFEWSKHKRNMKKG